MRKIAALALSGLLAAATAPAHASASAPHLPITSFDQLAKPLPLPYDTAADANRAVTEARQRARIAGKLLLIDLGGNWCLDCRILAGTIDTAPLRAFIDRHFEVVTVDVGRFDKNLQIPAHYGITHRLEGVPAVLIVDPKTDTLVNAGHVTALADARSMTPQALADWLASWTR